MLNYESANQQDDVVLDEEKADQNKLSINEHKYMMNVELACIGLI